MTKEYVEIKNSIVALDKKISKIIRTIADAVEELLSRWEIRFILKMTMILSLSMGVFLLLISNPVIWGWIMSNLFIVGILFIAIGMILFIYSIKIK